MACKKWLLFVLSQSYGVLKFGFGRNVPSGVRGIFSESHFSWFFPVWNAFFPVGICILVNPKQISVVSKGPLLIFIYNFIHFSFQFQFTTFLFKFPFFSFQFFLAFLFPVGHHKFLVTSIGGALCPLVKSTPSPLLRHWSGPIHIPIFNKKRPIHIPIWGKLWLKIWKMLKDGPIHIPNFA